MYMYYHVLLGLGMSIGIERARKGTTMYTYMYFKLELGMDECCMGTMCRVLYYSWT